MVATLLLAPLSAASIQVVERAAWLYHADGTMTASPADTNFSEQPAGNLQGSYGWLFTNSGHSALTDVRLLTFLDADLDREETTFFNEYAELVGLGLPPGAPAGAIAATSWEADEPGYVFGNIYANLLAGLLDNSNSVTSSAPDDVSLALGFALPNVPAGGTVRLTLLISGTNSNGLRQVDPLSGSEFWWNGYAEVIGGDVPPPTPPGEVPEPGTLSLMVMACIAALVLRRPLAAQSALGKALKRSLLTVVAAGNLPLASAQSLPDLHITSISTSSVSVSPGNISGSLAISLANRGTSSSPGFRVGVWEDRNSNLQFDPSSEIMLGSASYSASLSAGGSATLVIALAGLVTDQRPLLAAKIDDQNAVTEASESNNVYYARPAGGLRIHLSENAWYRYVNATPSTQVPSVPANWFRPEFDDSSWFEAPGPFGTSFSADLANTLGASTPDSPGYPAGAAWSVHLDPYLRTKFYLPSRRALTVWLAVDNGIEGIFLNGVRATAAVNAEGPAFRWEHVFDIPAEYTKAGENTLALQLEDHGVATGFALVVTDDDPAQNPVFTSNPPLPDLSVDDLRKNDSSFPQSVRLTIRLSNGGGSPIPAGTKVAFYRGDPAGGGQLIGTAQTSASLSAGQTADLSIQWAAPPTGLHPIVAVADDNGTGLGTVLESDETNNKGGSNILVGVGPFLTVDDLTARFKDSSVDLRWTPVVGAAAYNVYRKSDGSSAQLIRAGATGNVHSDLGLRNGTPYYYSVRWVNAQGVESGDGTEASATPTLLPSNGDTPPSILSSPGVRARAGAGYQYQLRAGDPDPGEVLTYSLVAPPSGMIVGTAGLITWTPAVSQAGYQTVAVRVQDRRGRFATQTYRLFVEVQVVDTPPLITSTPITRATSGELYSYQVTARDPENGLLRYTLTTAPAGMTINAGTGLVSWLPARAQVGAQATVVQVTDFGGSTASQSFTVQVARGNRPPVISSFAPPEGRVGTPYAYAVAATDPEGDPITYTVLAPPAGLTINASTGLVQWTPPAAQQGTTVSFTVRATDNGGLFASQNVSVAVRPPNQPPVITSTPVTTADAGSLYSYAVTASDPNLPEDGLTYALTTAPAGMVISATTGLIRWVPVTNQASTTQNVAVQVKDVGGLTATQSFAVRVSPAVTELPTVTLPSLPNGTVLTSDFPVSGSVTGPGLRLWRLEYQPVGGTTWFPLDGGTAPVTNGSLGTIPATLLANNTYRFRLYAENTVGSITTQDVEVQVDTQQLKLGDFTLRFEDLRVPGFTFPISILRTYDSKRPQAGDFGPGWALGFSEVDVRVDGQFDVFVTLPDARRVKFRFAPTCASPVLGACLFNIVNMAWTGEGGVADKLESLDCPTGVSAPVTSCDILGDRAVPNQWRLTTKEGLRYLITGSRVTRMEDRVGNWIEIGYTGVTSNTGRNVTFERNPQGLITRIVEPGGTSTLRYEYDAQGRLSRFVSQTNAATTFGYEDARFPHYLTRITDALGRPTLRNVFNTEGRLIAQCDANGNPTTLAGCTQMNPQPGTRAFTAINGRGFRTELTMDERGNAVTERRYLDGSNFLETTRTYDANNNLLTERDPEGNVKTYTYDARNNRLTETDPGGRTTRYTYNTACDKAASITDPAGSVTTNTYDAQCNLRFVRDALNNSTEYRYNSFGQRTHMVDPNGTTWTWAYAPNGLLQSLTDPFGKATRFTFDAKGNLLSRTDRLNRRIDFQYDAANRLTREAWDNGRVATFMYDALGALLTANDPDSRLTMTYDNLGRLTSVDNVGTPGAPRVLMTYSYDANGNTTRVQDSLGGSTDYTYDGLDRLVRVTQSGTGVQEKRVDMTYTPASLLKELKRFANLIGTQAVANTTYEYDCGGCPGRLTAIRHRKAADNAVLHDLTFGRDVLGNIATMTDAEGSHTYGYDVLRRLTSATHSNAALQPNESYSYDGVGNRLTSHLSQSYTYSWQTTGRGNRLLQDAKYDYVYDDAGNLVRRTERVSGLSMEFLYDYRNRLASIISKTMRGAETARWQHTYDLLDRRISSKGSGQTDWFVYDAVNPMLKLTGEGVVTSRRLYSRTIDSLLGEEDGGRTVWFLLDQVGTTRDLLSSSAVTLSRYRYDSFGRLLSPLESVIKADFGFVAREFDASGMGYFRARYYDPTVGRFTGEDPLIPFQYSYAENSPMTYVDRRGLFPNDVQLYLGAAVVQNVTRSLAQSLVARYIASGIAIGPLAPVSMAQSAYRWSSCGGCPAGWLGIALRLTREYWGRYLDGDVATIINEITNALIY